MAIIGAALVAFFAGKKTEQSKQKAKNFEASKDKKEVKEDVETQDDNALVNLLRRK